MKKLLLACASIALLWSCNNGPQKKEEATATKTGTVNFPVSQREIFSLSMLSNLPASIAWPYFYKATEQQMADSIITYASVYIDSTILYASDSSTGTKFTLSNWKRVWGPAIIVDSMCELCNEYQGELSKRYNGRARVPVSSMTIFKDNNNNYVVGIEATNPSSITDWVDLDLKVFSTVPFDNDKSHGSLSQGTSIGLNTYLLHLTDMHTNQTAMQFLDTVSNMASLTITGHSLGGALSPVFALYLKNNLKKNNSNIYCLATAGASPGDMDFIKYYDQQLGNNSVRLWNSLDVVPHAWEPDTMGRIDSIYQPKSGSIAFDSPYNCNQKTKPSAPFAGMATPADIKAEVGHLIKKLNNKGLKYGSICNGGQTYTGTQKAGYNYFNSATPSHESIFNLLFPNDLIFIEQLGNQHVAAYTMYFQIVGIHNYTHSWITGNKLKNSVANWACNPEYRKCLSPIPIPALAHDSSASITDTTVALWGLLQHAAWQQ